MVATSCWVPQRHKKRPSPSRLVLYASTSSRSRDIKEGQEEEEEREELEEEETGGDAGGSLDLREEQERLKQLEEEIYAMAGKKFKITSYVELSRVLFEDLKLPVVKQPTNKVLGGVSLWMSQILKVTAIYILILLSCAVWWSCITVLLHKQLSAQRAVYTW